MWFVYSGKGLTCMGLKPCMSGSEYHCYPIITDSASVKFVLD